MSEQEDKLKALFSINDTSFINQREILEDLNTFLADCTQDLHEFGIEFENAGLFEKLLFQILYHNSSLLNLTNGSSIKVRDKKIDVSDMTAVYSLARLQIETFVNLCYIFFLDIDYSKNLRAYVYKIHGLRKQLFLTQKHTKDFTPILKMRNELAQELKNIRKLEEFKVATFAKREKFINPKYARLITPNEVYELIQIGDLSRSHSLYSNHIHSEYISIRQLNSALKKSNESERSFSTVLLTCSRITSLIIKNLNSQYDLKEGSFSKAPSLLIKLVESLNELSAKL
ncbi:hypothetical protein [Psychroserpens sp. SPM9]|uniref:hypothetical protein n=1 Tax=Psychroserpens sp. SPM9 TaxID=2975598 RepID=UPI0021A691CB|nr:hypothetical protein [Psychroserpens sp. SPM9]MDG5493222.1 hypothetical protein [Psychroserpens sp. SPM9]